MEAARKKQEFLDLIESRGASIIGDAGSALANLRIRCKRGHEWSDRVPNIYLGAWCPECRKIPLKDAITELLAESKYEYQTNYPITNTDIVVDWAVDVNFEAIYGCLDFETAQKLTKIGYHCAHVTSEDLTWINRALPQEKLPVATLEPVPGSVSEPELRMFPIGSYGRSYYKDLITGSEDIIPNVVGYCRKNASSDTEGLSIEAQEDAIKEHCKQFSLSIRRIYYDIGLPGGDTRMRFGLQRMLEEVSEGDVIMISSISRLSRNIRDVLKIYNSLEERDVSLYAIDPIIDTSTPEGKGAIKSYEAFCSDNPEYKTDSTSTTSHNGLGQVKSRGRPPFGWRFVAADRPFEKNEDEQRIIEKIRRYRLETPEMNLSAICRQLDADGDVCRQSKEWTVMALQRIMIHNGIPMLKYRDRDN